MERAFENGLKKQKQTKRKFSGTGTAVQGQTGATHEPSNVR
jgi:hypothetical protein